MKKVFHEKDIDSLIFKIKQNGMDTMRRILFPLSKKDLNKKLNEISELSQGDSVVRPSLVTSDGVAYHMNDDEVIKEIAKSKETIHGKGEIKMFNKDVEKKPSDDFNLNDDDELIISLEIKEDPTKTKIENQKILNQTILDSLPTNGKNK